MPENKEKTSSPILKRLAVNDISAAEDCIAAYGGPIWTIAIKETSTAEAAERLTLEIFNDIWKYAPIFNKAKCSDVIFINLIVRHRLTINYLRSK